MAGITAAVFEPGDLIVVGQGLAEPTALLTEVLPQTATLSGLRIFGGMSMTGMWDQAPDHVDLTSFVGMGRNAALVAAGRLHVLACQMSEIPRLFATDQWRPDVVAVLVSPPDADGVCSLGLQSDYLWHALEHARAVIAEINPNVPFVEGDTLIPLDRFAATMTTDRDLPSHPAEPPSGVEARIADQVVSLIDDGACMQIGIGRFADAVINRLSGHRDLGVHSGMIGDALMDLIDAGVVTNRHKSLDCGRTVAGAVLGTAQCLERVDHARDIELRSIGHTHDPAVLGMLDQLTSVNSAVEVDLLGQVNAETASSRYIGGVGGSLDFMRGARSSAGGRSIVALPSTGRMGTVSRIVATVETVTAARSDVDAVVTEHGIADLRGVSLDRRPERLIAIAAPEHRAHLTAAAAALTAA